MLHSFDAEHLSAFILRPYILLPSPISIANYGEDRLVAALLAELPPLGPGVLTPPGDDCAVVLLPRPSSGSKPARRTTRQLLKTDCVIEGIHFTPDTPPPQIGWKALCRPLSDIAAMGGTPQYALITLALSPDTPLDWATGIYAGIAHAAREFGVDVAGGETARSPGPCFINVCLTGANGNRNGKKQRQRGLRSGGRPGDLLYVTGHLGGSFESGRHLTFRPRLEEGRWLVKHFPIRAMMDLSDGLGADLPRLARLSGTGFRLDRAALPCQPGCTPDQALGDGEDYELLFALGPRRAKALERAWVERFPDVALTRLGELTLQNQDDSSHLAGFDHFQSK